MVLYSPHTGPRVSYMAGWLGQVYFGQPIPVHSRQDWDEGQPVLNYSNEEIAGSYRIAPCGLLFEEGIREQEINFPQQSGLPFFFQTAGDHPFDFLSAAFYLLSRYEEYLPHQKDMYGRYAHENSLAFKHGVLKRPLVDEWAMDLQKKLQRLFPGVGFSLPRFSYLPTYDLDMAWNYREKNWWRTAGGFLKQLVTGKKQELKERRSVLAGKKRDPFDVFEDLANLHRQHTYQPLYFFLLAARQKGYDKNIPPRSPSFRSLVRQLSNAYDTGIHLSWQAWNNPELMQSEIKELESITANRVFRNRMHYIKFELPTTYSRLIDQGITEDYSMGYGSINGFRASTSYPFMWYNLQQDVATALTLTPFCYMEANSIFEQKDDPQTALREMNDYLQSIRKVGGVFCSIFHNHLVGLDNQGRDWWEVLEAFFELLDN